MYSYLIIFRIFLTWFPNFNWKIEPFHTVSQLTDPFLNVFRGLLPPIANIDFTPIFGIMVLQWMMGVLDSSTLQDATVQQFKRDTATIKNEFSLKI